jgi:hypothetical protein
MNDSVIEPTVVRVTDFQKRGRGCCTVAVGARTPPRRLVVGCLARYEDCQEGYRKRGLLRPVFWLEVVWLK